MKRYDRNNTNKIYHKKTEKKVRIIERDLQIDKKERP